MAAQRPTGPSSGKPRPTPTSAEPFSLIGSTDLPDPDYHAFRKDLADIALAGRVIASHYAEPVCRHLTTATALVSAASEEADTIRILQADDMFAMLDDSLGWAWGYAAGDRRVGYVRSDALRA